MTLIRLIRLIRTDARGRDLFRLLLISLKRLSISLICDHSPRSSTGAKQAKEAKEGSGTSNALADCREATA
jgi:hypothetical protein